MNIGSQKGRKCGNECASHTAAVSAGGFVRSGFENQVGDRQNGQYSTQDEEDN